MSFKKSKNTQADRTSFKEDFQNISIQLREMAAPGEIFLFFFRLLYNSTCNFLIILF